MLQVERELLIEVKGFIEKAIDYYDWNDFYGLCRTLDELIEDGCMPEVYHKICDKLKETE